MMQWQPIEGWSRRMSEWMDIETAPRGGPLLLFEKRGAMKRRYNLASHNPKFGGEFFVGRYSQHHSCWLSMPGDYVRSPTHWLPLPEPPKDVATDTTLPPEMLPRCPGADVLIETEDGLFQAAEDGVELPMWKKLK